MADNPRSSQQELSKDLKTDNLRFQRTTSLQQITEKNLRTEIMRRIYRIIAINSSLKNFTHIDVGEAKFYQNRDRSEPDTQSNVKF